jgi:hypothetical protein
VSRELTVLSHPDTAPVRAETPFSVWVIETANGVRGSHEMWLTPDEADAFAADLKAAAAKARRKEWNK